MKKAFLTGGTKDMRHKKLIITLLVILGIIIVFSIIGYVTYLYY